MSCPCGSESTFESCCEKYLLGKANPETAEKLMRSRYSAFVKREYDYIWNTHDEKTRDEISKEEIKDWSNNSTWIGLEILNTENGLEEDETGVVEFVANYSVNDQKCRHHEKSDFVKVDNNWFFREGKVIGDTQVRTAPKVGRNDPCPCGSGKKHKKCCL